MERLVQTFSIIYVSNGDATQVFRSIEEMPEEVRRSLIRTARTSQVETLIIANEKGRQMLEEQAMAAAAAPGAPSRRGLPKHLRWAIAAVIGGLLGVLFVLIFHLRP